MDEAIGDGGRSGGPGKDLAPLLEGQVCGDDGGAALVAPTESSEGSEKP